MRRQARDHGRLVAGLLRGAWRQPPPRLDLSPSELADCVPALLRTGSAAIGWWRLRGTSAEETPELLPLRQAYRRQALDHEVQSRQLPAIIASLRDAGIEPLLAKGWAVARLYPEPALRPYVDFDLYVAVAEHPAARARLTRGGTKVDLHRGASDLDDRSFTDLRARSVSVILDGTDVRAMGPEDHLRLLCLHLLRHGGAKPIWLCDVAVMLESRPPEFDWDCFLSGNARRTEAALCVLGLAQELLGADLAGTPIAEKAKRLPSWAAPTLLRQWAEGSVRREPMALALFRPGRLEELARHWPNGLEASYGVGAPFNEWPRLPFQLAHVAVRAARFSRMLPGYLWRRTGMRRSPRS